MNIKLSTTDDFAEAIDECDFAKVIDELSKNGPANVSLYLIGGPPDNALRKLVLRPKLLTRLKCLRISNIRMNEQIARLIAQILKISSSLRSLILKDISLTSSENAIIIDGVRKSISLQTLDLSNYCISIDNITEIATIISGNSSVQNLILKESDIGRKESKALACALIKSTSLKSLNLSKNRVDAQGMYALAAALLINPSLSYLDISNNFFALSALKSFIAVLTEKVIHIYVDHPAINSILDFRIEGARFLALEQAQTDDTDRTNPPPPAVRFFSRDGDHAIGTRVMRFLAEKPSLPFTRAELDSTLQSLREEAARLISTKDSAPRTAAPGF
jgi:hypothetical protein